MKKIYTLCAAALLASSVSAQQLPDNIGTFDGAWEDCVPNSINGSNKVVGVQPAGWGASNVNQVFPFAQLVTQQTGRSGSGYSVHLRNYFCGIGSMGSTAPAYITLGDAWNYGDYKDLNTENDASDGGVYGGIDFSYRPDAIQLWVKRNHATSASNGTINSTENATVLVYAWKGSTESTVGTGLDMSNKGGTVVTMPDRDKDVLGMITEGVTKSEDFELISKSENYFAQDYADWTQLTYGIDYLSESVPEKLNIVISSSDYFNRANLGVENTLDVDDVTLVYYSTLNSLSIAGTEVALTEGTYNYTITSAMPTAEEVVYATKGRFATADVTIDEAARTVTLVVTNQGGADLDGETSHTYVITCEAPAVPVEYNGYLNIVMDGTRLTANQVSTVEILATGENTCTFTLPDFNLGGELALGDIVVENVTTTYDESTGQTTYEGSTTGMQLVSGAITADVTITGFTDENGNVDFTISVIWIEGGNMPIDVTFTSYKKVVDTKPYTVYENVTLGEELLVDDKSGTLTVNYYGDGTGYIEAPFSATIAGLEGLTAINSGELTITTNDSSSEVFSGSYADEAGYNVVVAGTITSTSMVDITFTITYNGIEYVARYTTSELTSVNDVNVATTNVYGGNGMIAINGYTGTAAVYSIDGKLINSVAVDNNTSINAAAGIYIVRIGGNATKVVVK